ncbi:MAG: PAS domain S-box protein, partial [bacterium]
HPRVEVVSCLEDGCTWAGTRHGAYRLGPTPWALYEQTADGVPLTGLALYADLNTPPLTLDSRDRLVQFDGEGWKPIADLHPAESLGSVITRPYENRIWIRIRGHAVEFSLDRNAVVRSVPIPLEHIGTGLFQSQTGRVFLLSMTGAYELVGDQWRPYPADPNYNRRDVRGMEEDRQGRLWVELDDAVEIWEEGSVESFMLDASMSVRHRVSAIHSGFDGLMWFGTSGSGLFSWDGESYWRHTIHDGLLSDLIRSIYQAADGTVWCGADSLGISSYRDGRWVCYAGREGLKGRVVRAIGEYPKGTIWIALQNAGVACYRPTGEGPNTLIQKAPQTIAPGEHGVFAFSGSDTWNLTSHEDLVFSWRILSRSTGSVLVPWSNFSQDTVVVTPRLDPGLYTFQVRAADKDRNVDRTAAEVNFRVLLPVWKTSEFVVTVSILSGIILIAVILLYQKHLSLRASEKKYRELIESINDIIYTLDEDGTITYVSPVIRSMLGYRPSDLIGRSGFDLVHPDDRSRSMETFQRILAGEPQINEYRFVAASGDLRWMRTSTRMVSSGNRVIGVHGIITDMTDRKQAEDALQKAHDELELRVQERTNDLLEANKALKEEIAERKRAEEERERLEGELRQAQKMEAIGQLAGGVAHDFNNLLTGIIGNISLAEMDASDEALECLAAAQDAADRAAILVQQLLAFSRKSRLEFKTVNLNRVVDEVSRLARQTIDRRIEIAAQTEENLPNVLADSTQMNSVLMNLCVNARDAISEVMQGRIAPERRGDQFMIKIETNSITVDQGYCEKYSYASPGRFVVLSVSDNGSGMDEEIQSRVFEPFFTTKELGKGTGLGLASTYGIVKQHDGWINISSRVGEGTTFSIYLPVAEEEIEEIEKDESEVIPAGTETILLVDDEKVIRNLAKKILEQYGYTVLLATDGKEALSKYQAEREQIALIVLDLSMPRLSGREVLEQLRSLSPDAKVIISTGYSEDDKRESLQELGAAAYVPKPYRPVELARAVRNLLDSG